MDRILELQELDLSVDRLQARREEIESGKELAEARRRQEVLEGRLGETRMALDGVTGEQARLENDVSMLTQKAEAEERRLYDGSVANPKELESIQAELKNLRDRRSRLEDGILEQMERREQLEGGLPQLEAEVEEARARVAEIEVSSETELQDIGSALGERAGERAALVHEIDEELLDLYEDLRSKKKGVGAAALVDGVCQGCRQQLSPLELDRLKKLDGVRRCDYCRRILILT
ncbi:MAG TPA: C4-type zinc ribbon domain-containing protein [Actinomycetota bacterium]